MPVFTLSLLRSTMCVQFLHNADDTCVLENNLTNSTSNLLVKVVINAGAIIYITSRDIHNLYHHHPAAEFIQFMTAKKNVNLYHISTYKKW